MPRRCATLLLVASLLALPACTIPTVPHLPPPSPGMSDGEVVERLEFIEERLEASRKHGTWWHRGWLAASVAGIGFGAMGAATTGNWGNRSAGITTAVLAAGGVAYLYLMPVDARFGADPLRALPDGTPEERRAKLARAQEILEENADRATVQVNWLSHAANTAVALAAGGIVWAVGKDAGPALSVAGQVIGGGEVQFWTEPAKPRHDIEDYVQRFDASPTTRTRLRLVPDAGGIALRLDF